MTARTVSCDSSHPFEEQLTAPYDEQGIDVESGRQAAVTVEVAESGGEETVAGSVATPDQNVVGENAEAIGITYHENKQLRCGKKERQRDIHRWELDPASADDYCERKREQAAATPRSRFLRWVR